MTRKGKALYEELIPRLLRREQEILSCLSAQERKDFAALLGKIESSLDLVQTGEGGGREGSVLRALSWCVVRERHRVMRLTERPSIPETPAIESRSRSVLDRPVKPGDDNQCDEACHQLHFTAVTTISTICGGSSSTPRQARIGGFLVSTHSSQARFISPLRFMSAM